jgi:hypothetical protein
MFSCPSCGRRFAWKPALAGKKVKCACGNVFVAQLQAPEDDYDLSDEPPPAPPPPQLQAAAPQLSAERVLQYAAPRVRREEDQELEKVSRLKSVYLPIAIILIGIAMRLTPFFIKGITQQTTLVMAAAAVGALVVNVILMLCGVLIASQFLDADFGSLRATVLKLTATAVVGGGAAGAILSLDWAQGGIQGPIIALHAMILIYWVMFAMFFELDLLENLFTVAIVMALHILAFCVAFGGMKVR